MMSEASWCVIAGVSFLQREPAKSAENKEIAGLETEWDEILKEASEEELVDLAGK